MCISVCLQEGNVSPHSFNVVMDAVSTLIGVVMAIMIAAQIIVMKLCVVVCYQ